MDHTNRQDTLVSDLSEKILGCKDVPTSFSTF